MWHRKNIIIAIILVLLALFAFSALRNFPLMSTGNPSGVITTTPKRITDASAAIPFKVDVSYPSFSGMANQNSQLRVNNLIRQQMENAITSFKEQVNVTEQNAGNLPPDLQQASNEFYITYKVARADDSIVSVLFPVMDYQVGMAHPSNYNLVFNYDVQRGKLITLNDLFKPDSNYLPTLETASRQQLTTRFSDNPFASDLIDSGTKPEIENFTLFTLTKTDIMIIFNPYQVAPYYAGTQTVTIPYATLRSVMQPDASVF